MKKNPEERARMGVREEGSPRAEGQGKNLTQRGVEACINQHFVPALLLSLPLRACRPAAQALAF